MMKESRLDTPIGSVQLFRGGTEGAPPLVYLHSAGGETHLEMLDDLSDDYDVIVPVLPGWGESEGGEAVDGPEDIVFHLLDVFDALGLGPTTERPDGAKPIVVGTSLGGWMALELATRYPERVAGLVLVNPVGLHLDGAPIEEMFGRSPAELAEMLFADQSHPIAATMHAMDEFTGDVGKQVEIPIELVVPMWKAMGATARIGWDPYLHNPKLRGRLHRVTVPVLVVAGARDGLVPRAHAETYAAELPDARLEVVDDAAHWLPLERPKELAALVRAFAPVTAAAASARP
jgi:pimeloyl-ACP methyl ester carboxylesterase